MFAKQLMTENPAFSSPDSSVREVADKMLELDVRHLPIVEDQKLVGIVSDRDLRSFSFGVFDHNSQGDEVEYLDTPIREIMHTDLITAEPDTNISEIISFMIESKVGAVPVVDTGDERLLGIISYIDVLRAAQELLN